MNAQPYTLIKLTTDNHVATITLNRPDVLTALDTLEADSAVRCVVLTGNERACAAGADIKEMAGASSTDMLVRDQFAKWDRIRRFKKPIIAAVSGYALGGGNELAMLCDMI